MQDPKQSEMILTDVPPKAFEVVLNYIYTGSVFIKLSYEDDVFDVLQLAHKYSLKPLENIINKTMTSMINTSNVCLFLNKADELGMDELKQVCLTFIDNHLSEIRGNKFLNLLTQTSMVKLLERDSFPALEIEVFEIAASWCKTNADFNNLVTGCVQLTKLTPDEILNVVWPSKVIDSDRLLNALAYIKNKSSNTVPRKMTQLKNKNIAIAAYNTTVISGLNTAMLLEGTEEEEEGAYHDENDKNGITLDLGSKKSFNHIKMKILGKYYSSYYLETSHNQKKWHKLIDYSQYSCSHEQNLYFDGVQQARYIRAVFSKQISLGKFEVSFDSKIPEVHKQIIYPLSNVVSSETKIFVGHKRRDIFTTITLILNQPYMISYMTVLLRFYVFIDGIETSTDYANWQTLESVTNEKDTSRRHILRFKERIVNSIKITGQLSSDKTWKNFKEFLEDFECFYVRDDEN
ncbi:BTB/POZ domain-containing protein 9-like isoform X3 [Zophobas morio]